MNESGKKNVFSDEVKTATPALLMATEIGVKSNTNAALANLPDKSAIVVMSFGTTFKDTREKTIDATVVKNFDTAALCFIQCVQ